MGQSVAGRHPMDQLPDKMVDKEQEHRLAMDFLVHSSSEVVVYSPSEAVVYFEAVACEVEVVLVRPSSEAVELSVEVLDRNY